MRLLKIFFLLIFIPSPALSNVVINEVFYDPSGDDNTAGNKEFIELYNNGGSPVDISRYKLQMAGPVFRTGYWIPKDTIILANDYFLIAEGETSSVTPDLVAGLELQNGNYQAFYNNAWHSFTGPVDGVRLIDADGNVLDCLLYNAYPLGNQNNLDTTGWGNETAYDDIPSGFSIRRVTVGADTDSLSDWETFTDPDPDIRGDLDDTDNDGIPDVVEDMIGSYKNNVDSDSDGLEDGEELKNWNFVIDSDETDPTDSDSDDDDLSDGLEVNTYYTQPRNDDTDGDTLLDGAEVYTHITSPLNKDTDVDGYPDNQEIDYGTDPNDAADHPGVVINEIYYDHPGSDAGKEYIVLFNPEEYDVDLTGFRIESGGTKFRRNVSFSQNTTIPSGCFYLISEEDVVDINGYPPDLTHWLKLQNGDQNDTNSYYYGKQSPTDSVRLANRIDKMTVALDTVLWDDPNDNNLPGDAHDPAQSDEFVRDVQSGHALRRKILGYDTNHKSDWIEVDPQPVSSSSGTDLDNDGLSNIEEAWNHTDPLNADTDGDGMSDSEELSLVRNPTLNESLWSSPNAYTLDWPTEVTIPNTKFGSRFNFNYLFDNDADFYKDTYFGLTCVRTSLYGSDHDKRQNFTVAIRDTDGEVWQFPLTFSSGADFEGYYFQNMKIDIGLTYTQLSGEAGDWAKVTLKTVCPFTPTDTFEDSDNKMNIAPFMYHLLTVENLTENNISGSILVALDGAKFSDTIGIDGDQYRLIYYHNDPEQEPGSDDLHFNDNYYIAGGENDLRAFAIQNADNIYFSVSDNIYDDFEDDGWLENTDTGEDLPGGIVFSFNNVSDSLTQTICYAGWMDETVPTKVIPGNPRYYYYYTVYPGFSSVTDVVEYAIENYSDIDSKTSTFESVLTDSKLNSKLKWIIAQAFHSYQCNTFLFRNADSDPPDEARFYLWEGDCNYFSTIDLGYETSIFTGYEMPWVLRMNLDQWSHATFKAFTSPPDDNAYYYWLFHDMGRGGLQIYNDGCSTQDINPDRDDYHFEGFRLEENLNYTLLSYWYWKRSGDWSFFTENDYEKLDLIWRLLESSIHSDQEPIGDPDGIADDAEFLGGQTDAKTTYDCYDFGGLYHPMENTYTGMKQMAAYIAADEMFSDFGVHTDDAWTCFTQASLIRDTLKIKYDGNNYIPVSFLDQTEIDSGEAYSPLVSEGLLYLILAGTSSDMLDSELMAMLDDTYKKSYETCKRNYSEFQDCIVLSSKVNWSWLSKILNEDFISQQIFGYKTDSTSSYIFDSLTSRPRAWRDAWNYAAMEAGLEGSHIYLSMYPRGICTWAFLENPAIFEYNVLESGDYNGDGLSDIAVFRPSSGLWAARNITRTYFGKIGDLPVSGDYNGNGTTNITIFRPSTGLWAAEDITTRVYFGQEGDIPVPEDYDDDGQCELAVFRPATGLWAVRNLTRVYFGQAGDIPVPEDYNGDGQADICFFRPSESRWYIRNITQFYFGERGDAIAVGDYDGDGKTDSGIYRDENSLWAIRDVTRVYFGSVWDLTVPADYNGDQITDIGIFRPSTGLWAVRGVSRVYYGNDRDITVAK